MNPNTETPKKYLACPNCGEDLNVDEYAAQECWMCGWPDMIDTPGDANGQQNAPESGLTGT